MPCLFPYFRSKISKCSSPHLSIWSMIGISDSPSSEIVYSERGGSSGNIVFLMSPSSTISLSWMSSTRGAASGRHLCISLGRRGRPSLSSSRIQDFHFYSIRLIVSLSGQSRSTGIFFSYAIVSIIFVFRLQSSSITY